MSGNLNMGTNKLIGGTGITDILKLQGTTGNGTTTNPAIQLLTGNNGGTTALTVLNNGSVSVGTTSPGAKLQIDTGSTSTVGQIIKGAASQTADLQQWQNSAGTVSSSVSSAGVISAPSFNSTGGKSIFFGSSSTQAPIRIVPWGTATNTVDGEVWATSGSGLFYNQNGYTIMKNLDTVDKLIKDIDGSNVASLGKYKSVLQNKVKERLKLMQSFFSTYNKVNKNLFTIVMDTLDGNVEYTMVCLKNFG